MAGNTLCGRHYAASLPLYSRAYKQMNRQTDKWAASLHKAPTLWWGLSKFWYNIDSRNSVGMG